jgi:hypothetical protein
MSSIKMCKQNLPSGAIRLCRIQYTSALRNQNLYYSHKYRIRLTREYIYTPGGYTDSYMDLYISTNGLVAEVTDNSFYVVDSGTYLDILANIDQSYYRVTCEVDCKEVGSVTLKLDVSTFVGATRLLIPDGTLTSMYNKIAGKNYSLYMDYSQSKVIKLNNHDTFILSINGDSAVIVGNAIGFAPTNWTLTKGSDITIGGTVVGSNYTVATSGIFRGTLLFI